MLIVCCSATGLLGLLCLLCPVGVRGGVREVAVVEAGQEYGAHVRYGYLWRTTRIVDSSRPRELVGGEAKLLSYFVCKIAETTKNVSCLSHLCSPLARECVLLDT